MDNPINPKPNTVNSPQKQKDFTSFPTGFSPPVYNQKSMQKFNRLFGRLQDATLSEALANRVVRDVITKNNLDPNDLSVSSLMDGTAPLLNTFNFRNKETGEVFLGSELSANDKARIFNSEAAVFDYFARGPSGERIKPGKFLEGAKSKILPAATSFPLFYAGAKATNMALSGIPPTSPLTALLRIGAPIIGGIATSIAGYKPAQTANDYIFGVPDVYLPDQAGAFKAGETFMEGFGWLYAPFLAKGNLGSNLITNFAQKKRLGELGRGPRMANFVERLLANTQMDARQKPIRTLLTELGATTGAAGAAEKMDGAEGAFANFMAEISGATIGGIGSDFVLKQAVPSTKFLYGAGVKLKDKVFRKNLVEKTASKLGDKKKAELAVYALEMISTVDDPDEVYRRLKWYTSSREAFEKTGKIPQSDTVVIPAKGKEGADNYVPPVTERDLFQEFGDIITETIDPATGRPINLPTALASNSLGFMLLQEANIGKSSSPTMQRRMNQLGDKAVSAHKEFTEIMQNMIIAGFASEDKDMIGFAAKLASDVFALDMEEDVAAAVLRYNDARAQLTGGDASEADLMQASKDLQGIILNRLNGARNNEKKIWATVPDYDIGIRDFKTLSGATNTMTLPDGRVVPVPNFVTRWLSILPADEKDIKTFLKDPDYKDINDYVNETLEELGYDMVALADRVDPPELASAKKAFNKAQEKLIGDGSDGRFQRELEGYIQRGEEMTTDDAIEYWRQTGIRIQEGASAYQTSEMRRRLARTLEARANLAIQQKKVNLADQDTIISDSISSRTLSFRRGLLLNKARMAGSMDDRQKANFLAEMGGAFLQDLESYTGNDVQYALARSYSTALNDAFTRPFVGKIIATDRSGAYRISPEAVIDTTFNSSFASERARAIDAIGQFEITQELTTLLNLSPLETNEAREAFMGSVANLPVAEQREIINLAEELNSLDSADAVQTIRNGLQNPDLSQNERTALENLLSVHETTATAIGQNLESAQAGLLIEEIRKQAFDTASGFIDLPKLREVLRANETLLDAAPNLKQAIYASLDSSTTTRGVMEKGLRKIRDFGFDDQGKFSRPALEKWMNSAEARGLLQAFPDMEKDLKRIIETDGEYLKLIESNRSKIKNEAAEQDYYYLLKKEGDHRIPYEDMAMPFEKLFDNSQSKPGELLKRFWNVAKNAPAKQVLEDGTEVTRQKAKRGFKTSLIGSILNQSGLKGKDTFSPIKAHELFFKPMPRSDNKITLAEWVVSNDVMTKGEVARLEKLLVRMGEIDMLVASGQSLNAQDLAEKMGTSIELLASALGSATASKLYRMVGGDTQGTGSLAVVSRGSSAAVNRAREIMSDMPAALKADFFIEVLENPDLAIDLLETGEAFRNNSAYFQRIIDFVGSRGFLYGRQASGLPYLPDFATSESLKEMYLSEEERQQRQENLDMLRSGEFKQKNVPLTPRDPKLNPFLLLPNDEQASLQSSGAPTPTGGPAPSPSFQLASASLPQNTPQSGPVDRTRYAAMFPNDPASVLIRQGIGSMMG
jgi:hypothetical protein